MNLFDRVRNILVTPRTEWPRIAGEPATPQSIYVGYVMLLAAIGPLAILIVSGGALIFSALIAYIVALAMTYVVALIVDSLATTFGGERNFVQSLKLTAYSYTAAWIAGVFHLVPAIGPVLVLVAAIYAWYTFYLGVPVMKNVPREKALGYTIVVVICAIVLGLVTAGLVAAVIRGGALGPASLLGYPR